MAKTFIVLNPVAGHSDPDAVEEVLRRHFDGPDDYHVHRTEAEEQIGDVVRSALGHDFDFFVAAGGDGTVSAVAGGLVGSGNPMGIIPVGTGNALAHDLGIPEDLQGAVRLLCGDHRRKRIDVLRVGEHVAVLNVGVGLSARVMSDTGSDEKRKLGFFAYVWQLLAELLGFDPQPFEIEIDGRRHHARAAEVMLLNSSAVGFADARWTSGVHIDDGRVAVLAVRARTVRDFVIVLWNQIFRPSADNPDVQHWTAQHKIVIRTEPTLAVQVDGDVVGETPLEADVLPGALTVLVPGSDPAQE